ncbi:MAG TPA: hypothetical protein VK762_16145 [Polyangiaceae bacterium]|nr:hypothetical protein [Polyangiaceae bacterium]
MLAEGLPAQIVTGSPAKVSETPLAPGVIVGHVPMIVGRYWLEGEPPVPSSFELPLELELELALASLISPELDPELVLDVEPELVLDVEPELPLEEVSDPELPLDPELVVDPELVLDPDPLLELTSDPELLPVPWPTGSSGPPEAAQAAMKAMLVNAEASVKRMLLSICGGRISANSVAHGVKALF